MGSWNLPGTGLKIMACELADEELQPRIRHGAVVKGDKLREVIPTGKIVRQSYYSNPIFLRFR